MEILQNLFSEIMNLIEHKLYIDDHQNINSYL